MKKTLIFDTNFLFVPLIYNIKVFDEIEKLPFPFKLSILSGTIQELNDLMNNKAKKGKTRSYARLLLKIINEKLEKNTLDVINSEKYVDNALITLISCDPKQYIVATGDKELRKRLLSLGIFGVIYVRKKKYLEFYSGIHGSIPL